MDEVNQKKAKLALIYMAVIMALVFSVWQVMLNNFTVEKAGFSGFDIGSLQSVREIPGFLAFTAVFILVFIREQTFAITALGVLSVGVLATGYFPSNAGLLITTFIMSVGFHYFETINSSLTLQWLPKNQAASFMGQVIGYSSFAGLLAFAAVWLLYKQIGLDYIWIYTIFGTLGIAMVLHLWFMFPRFENIVPQRKKLFLKKRYWVYYLLTFLKGARRQIFMVFAAYLMVEKFGYTLDEIAALFLINKAANIVIAPLLGKMIEKIGERKALTIEYVGLVGVFVGYAVVESAMIAAVLYVVDHLFFGLAIGIKTYFQKIADSEDMAATQSVSFTIDHIASVVIPITFGVIWMSDPSLVFYAGAGFAFLSLIASNLIPNSPAPGNEFIWSKKRLAA
ncbi:MFS transporter [Pseudemcibacter aquimaris]|uniref:MFS transporter n=1 Tax=Pseudemcibacter aquimaris TaxID=2857064 RepID=UPI002013A44A|nr:MFS transporter [Pseudemcibacter aquimaris]MCC3861582.1 MFS transporter [Pseudemcibacter aquimaris]WDU58351.1 MFS transporter [Pseudemcibacter aquimaris]